MLTPDDAAALEGAVVRSRDGREIGELEEVYVYPGDNDAAWAAVRTPSGRVVVPLLHAERSDGEVVVAHDAEVISEAPAVEGDAVTAEEQAGLLEHYDLSDAEFRDDSGASAARTDISPQGTARDPGGATLPGATAGHP